MILSFIQLHDEADLDAITLYAFILVFINMAENLNTLEINEILKQLKCS